MLVLCLMLLATYYQNYAGIIGGSLAVMLATVETAIRVVIIETTVTVVTTVTVLVETVVIIQMFQV